MFSDASFDNFQIESTWKKVRKSKERDTQTEERSYEEEECQTLVSLFQTTETSHGDAQTVHFTPAIELAFKIGDQWIYGDPKKVLGIPESNGPGNDDSIQEDLPVVDEPMLAFLDEVGPDMVTQLERSMKTSAFDGYFVNWEEQAKSVSIVNTFNPAKPCDADLSVTSLSWNSNGTILAASYGRIDVCGWCYERGYVCTWNVTRGDLNPTKADLTLEVDNYVMSIDYHPEEPTLLCGGTYNGEVMVWDTGKEEDNVICQSGNSLSPHNVQHTDPVHKIQWVANRREQKTKWVIVSISGDGKILIWSLTNNLNTPVGGYEVGHKKGGAVGVTCLTVLHQVIGGIGSKPEPCSLESTVLIGTESAAVQRTSIKPATIVEGVAAKNQKVKLNLSDPVVFKYEVHKGPVQQIHASPFHRNLFLTGSSDGSVKMFNVYDSEKIHSVVPSSDIEAYIYDAQFSPMRPYVFACVSRDGYLYIYDLHESRIKPVVAMEAGDDGCPVLSMQFNKTNKEYLATGDNSGQIKIWKLSSRLSNLSTFEAQMLSLKKAETRNDCWFKHTGLVL